MKTSSAKERKLNGSNLRPLKQYRQAYSLQEYLSSRYIKDNVTECWNWNKSLDRYGYGVVSSAKWFRRYAKRRAHSLAYICWNGKIPNGLSVLHKCDNRKCINPEHLKLGTHEENMRDMVQRGRAKTHKGETNGMSKLTEKDVKKIRKEYTSKTNKQLAKEFSVSPALIEQIGNRKIWKHVN